MPAQIPHSRMPLVHASSANPELAQRFGLAPAALPGHHRHRRHVAGRARPPRLPRDLDAGRRALLRGGRAELEGVSRAAPQPRARHRHPHRSRPAAGARGRVGAAGRRSGRREPRGERLPPAARGRVRPAGHRAAARRPTTWRQSSSATCASSTTRPVDRERRARPPARPCVLAALAGRPPLPAGRGDTDGATARRGCAGAASARWRSRPPTTRWRRRPTGSVPPEPAAVDACAARARHPRLPDRRVLRHARGGRVYTDLSGPLGEAAELPPPLVRRGRAHPPPPRRAARGHAVRRVPLPRVLRARRGARCSTRCAWCAASSTPIPTRSW